MNTPSRTRSPSFVFRSGGAIRPTGAVDAASFLQSHDRLAALLPAVKRIVSLRKDCAKLLPALFGGACDIVHFENGNLVLAVPNAAVAARLKQQLPKLQDGLAQLGWQVSAIRLKVQVSNLPEQARAPQPRSLPAKAVSAFSELENALEATPANAALRQAVAAMVARHKARGA